MGFAILESSMPRLTAFVASALLAACLPAACTTTPMHEAHAAPAEFVIVRHAEKAAGAGDDPALTDAGHARAAALAHALRDAPVVAVYSTGYARTRQTAGPTAAAHGLEVSTYDAREPAEELATRLRAMHPAGTVVVVGHSNTVPAIAAALCGCEVPPMEETEYDRRLLVSFDAAGNPTLATGRLSAVHGP